MAERRRVRKEGRVFYSLSHDCGEWGVSVCGMYVCVGVCS